MGNRTVTVGKVWNRSELELALDRTVTLDDWLSLLAGLESGRGGYSNAWGRWLAEGESILVDAWEETWRGRTLSDASVEHWESV